MRGLARGIVGFVVGDDVWIAVGVLLLLGGTAVLVQLDFEARWVLPAGVPAALWISLVRARRLAR
ncbi:MAG: hypothetical protein WCJ67_01630 [Thermoleophilia bacterium]